MKFSIFSGAARCFAVAALALAGVPVAEVSADLIATFNFTGASLVSSASSPIATASNYTFNSLNTNQHTASSGLSNVFVNAGYAPFNSTNSWPVTLANSGTNSAPSGGNTGISELNIWNGFTITKASGVESLNFEKVSFQYGASGTGAAAALPSMSLGVYFRETGSVGDFTFLGSAFATAVGTGAGSGGDISALATQEVVFAQPFLSNGGQFRFYFRDNVSPDVSSFSFSQTHRLDSINLTATAVPEPSTLALVAFCSCVAIYRRRMGKR